MKSNLGLVLDIDELIQELLDANTKQENRLVRLINLVQEYMDTKEKL